MSVKMMAQIWECGPEDGTDTLVLLALADFANDKGECWPAVASVAKKARMTERGARKVIRRLEAAGWLSVEVGGGRHGCSVYTVNPEPRSPRNHVPPEPECTKPGTRVHETRNRRSPEPSRTIIEPSEKKARSALDLLCEVASLEASRSFIAYRRKQKGKALSETAATRQAKQLAEIARRGGDPDDALGMAEERGWQAVQADWYFKALSQQTPKQEKADVVGLAQRAAARARGMDRRPDHDPAVPLLPASRWRGNSGGGAG